MNKIVALGRKYDLLMRGKPMVGKAGKLRLMSPFAHRNDFSILGNVITLKLSMVVRKGGAASRYTKPSDYEKLKIAAMQHIRFWLSNSFFDVKGPYEN